MSKNNSIAPKMPPHWIDGCGAIKSGSFISDTFIMEKFTSRKIDAILISKLKSLGPWNFSSDFGAEKQIRFQVEFGGGKKERMIFLSSV